MENMTNLISLSLTSKEEDKVLCSVCKNGIFVPDHPESKINHSFHCNKCGAKAHIDPNIIVE